MTEPVREQVTRSYKRAWAVGALALLVSGAALALAVGGSAPTPPEAGLTRYTDRLAGLLEATGTVDPAAEAQLTDAARAETGCGHVHPFVIPASALGCPAAPGQPPLEVLVTQYLKKEFKADAVAVTTALEGQAIVAAGGWNCE